MISELRTWQKDLLDVLMEEPDDRTVRWYTDVEGGAGKSAFLRHLMTRTGLNVCPITGGSKVDVSRALVNFLDGGEEPDVIVIDLPRSHGGTVSYRFIEEVKNGVLTSTKYDSKTVVLEQMVHIVVFANREPDLAGLSEDQWVVIDL